MSETQVFYCVLILILMLFTTAITGVGILAAIKIAKIQRDMNIQIHADEVQTKEYFAAKRQREEREQLLKYGKKL